MSGGSRGWRGPCEHGISGFLQDPEENKRCSRIVLSLDKVQIASGIILFLLFFSTSTDSFSSPNVNLIIQLGQGNQCAPIPISSISYKRSS